MGALRVVWHGSMEDSHDLIAAIARNCTCQYFLGMRQTTCAPHQMLSGDQRALDGLLYARRLAERLWMEEMAS